MTESVDFPLASVQEMIWRDQSLNPESPLYIIGAALEFDRPLDAGLMQQALVRVVAAHQAMRLVMRNGADGPTQAILPTLDVRLPVHRCTDDASARAQMKAAFSKPFELLDRPLWRVELFLIDERRCYLLVAVHHLVNDGFGMVMLFNRLAEAYTAAANGTAQTVETPAYTDYITDDRSYLESARIEKDREFWQALFTPPPTNPRRRTTARTAEVHESGTVYWQIERPLYSRMTSAAGASGLSAAHFMIALFAACFARLDDAEDVVIGLPVHNRSNAAYKQTLGLFASVIPLRLQVARDQPLITLMQSVAALLRKSYRHQRLPIAQINRAAGGSAAGSQLFDVVVSLEQFPADTFFGGAKMRVIPLQNDFTRTPLSVHICDFHADEPVTAELYFDKTVFSAAEIERIVERLALLFRSALEAPQQPIDDLKFCSEAERNTIQRFNPAAPTWPLGRRVETMFAEQASRNPEAIALRFENESCTYRALDERTNRLAHSLTVRGIGPESRVGISLDRSIDAIVAIVGVLKTGAAYVPLDPSYPTARLAFMATDARLDLLLTHSSLLPTFADQPIGTVCIDSEAAAIAACPANAPVHSGTFRNVAYVVFTSGSSGRPKGVAVEHNGVCNFVQWQRHAVGVGPGSNILQFGSLSFDSSVWEIFGALCNGATLVLARQATLVGPDLGALMRDQAITHATLPPVILGVLEEHGLPDLRMVISAGEACRADLVRRWAPGRMFFNGYGPTENSVCATLYRCDESSTSAPPIGKPIPGIYCRILDRNGRLAPIGVPGELCVGGVALARGYLFRDDLTAERFVSDPFAPGQRLYRTGDRGYYREDGNIEFLGRIDGQVKLRSFRIELAEIESVLNQHVSVANAAVDVREDTPGIRQLVAYVVLKPGSELDSAALQAHMAQHLPEYMVARVVIPLDAIPMTPNGKIDRKALPVPPARDTTNTSFEAPRLPVESVLAGIWQKLLGVPAVGVHDNFFELGGDSILAIQVIARAREAGIHLTPAQLFRHPTIAQLSEVATQAPAASEEAVAPGSVAPLVPIQQWFFEQRLQAPDHWNQSLLLEVKPPLNASVLRSALSQVLARHDAFRLRFVRGAAGWTQRYDDVITRDPLVVLDRTAVPFGDEPLAIERDVAAVQSTLRIESGPLVRCVYLDFGPRRSGRLLIAVHHLVMDGVSWRIVTGDLDAACKAVVAGSPISFPARTASIKTWAEHLSAYAQSPEAKEAARYWTQLPPAPASLPADAGIAGENLESTTRLVTGSLTARETDDLLRQVPRVYQTRIDEILLAALAQAIRTSRGTDAVALRLEGHGRELPGTEIDLSRTVGWFTSLYPVRLDLAGAKGPAQVIKSVKEQLRAIPGKGVPYAIVRYLAPNTEVARQLASAGEPDITFNYLGNLDQGLFASEQLAPAVTFLAGQRAGGNRRVSAVEVETCVQDSQLQLRVLSSSSLHRRETLQRFMDLYISSLRELITHCLSPSAGGYTPSDFELAGLSQGELDDVVAELQRQFE